MRLAGEVSACRDAWTVAAITAGAGVARSEWPAFMGLALPDYIPLAAYTRWQASQEVL